MSIFASGLLQVNRPVETREGHSAGSTSGRTGTGGGTTFQVVDADDGPGPSDTSSPAGRGPPAGDEGSSSGGGGRGRSRWVLGLSLLVVALLVGGTWAVGWDDVEEAGSQALAPLLGSGNDSANWSTLEVNLRTETSQGAQVFSTEVAAYNRSGAEIPVDEIEDRGDVHYLVSDEPIEPPARNRSGWSYCDPVDCRFTIEDARYVYVGWDHRKEVDSGLPWNSAWIDLQNDTKVFWVPPGRWDFEEPWNGEHEFSVSKAEPRGTE